MQSSTCTPTVQTVSGPYYVTKHTTGGEAIMLFGRPTAVRCLLTPISRNVIGSGGITIKLATNIHHVSVHCLKGLQGQRSKAKVTANALLRRRHTSRQCGAEAQSLFCFRLLPVAFLFRKQ